MAYQSSSGLPMERASKIAHMKLIKDDTVIELLQSFNSDETPKRPSPMNNIPEIDLTQSSEIKHIVTVDGGLSIIPNPIKRNKAVAFIQVGTCLLHLEDIDRMKADPMMDPRDVSTMLKKVGYRPAVIPLAGIHKPHMTVKESIRHCINSILSAPYSNLYWVLEFIIHRQWMGKDSINEKPNMSCYKCSKNFELPRNKQLFNCPHCNHEHFLSDYLQIANSGSEDWSREDHATAMMSVLEHLSILEIPAICVLENKTDSLKEFLFVKDGPLLLRAALSRLVEPIRDFLQWLKNQRVNINLVGIEKTGDLANFFDEQKHCFSNNEGQYIPGKYFLPDIPFLLEEVSGQTYNADTYRNRVNYGAKVGIALSNRHMVVLNVPTGEFKIKPLIKDLIGFEEIVRTLSRVVSSSYENAIIPLVLANQAVSLSFEPSGTILKQFIDNILSKNSSDN